MKQEFTYKNLLEIDKDKLDFTGKAVLAYAIQTHKALMKMNTRETLLYQALQKIAGTACRFVQTNCNTTPPSKFGANKLLTAATTTA